MRLICDGDLVVGLMSGDATGGVAAPAELQSLPISQLRFVGGEIVDAADIFEWRIDDLGRKHAIAGEGWQPLSCAWDAPLIKDNGVWRVRVDADDLAFNKKRGDLRVIDAVDAAAAQMTAGYAKAEIDAWGAKAATARAALAGDASAQVAPLLLAEAQGRGVSVNALAQTIVARAEVFEAAIGAMSAMRAAAQTAIAAAANQSQIDAAIAALSASIAAFVEAHAQ